MKKPVYLDHMSTTPLDPRVGAVMGRSVDLGPVNPHASTHDYGWAAARAVRTAGEQVARLIGASPAEVIFTSGATEANNLAVRGALEASGRSALVISAVEHPSVLETARALERQGVRLDVVPVDENARIDPAVVDAAIDDDTGLVSIMLANNETATLEPVAEIGALCRKRGVPFHTDAVQAPARMAIDVNALNADLLSLSAHKMYGPMGIGVLYVRQGTALRRQMHGGAQQGGMRGGTVATPLAIGFGEAARLAKDELSRDISHLSVLSDSLWQQLKASIPGLLFIAEGAERLPGCLTVRHPGVNAEDWLLASPRIAASSGAACASADSRPSHVLQAAGLTAEDAAGAIRLSVGRMTTQEDVDLAAAELAGGLAALRRRSPGH